MIMRTMLAASAALGVFSLQSAHAQKIDNMWFGLKPKVESEGFVFTGAPRTNYQPGTVFIVEKNAQSKKPYRRVICDQFYEAAEWRRGDVFIPSLDLEKQIETKAGLSILKGLLPASVQVGATFEKEGFKEAHVGLLDLVDFGLPTSLAASTTGKDVEKARTELFDVSSTCQREMKNYVDSEGRAKDGVQIFVITRTLSAGDIWYDFSRAKTTGGGLDLGLFNGMLGINGGGKAHITERGVMTVNLPPSNRAVIGQNWQQVTRASASTNKSGENEFSIEAAATSENPFADGIVDEIEA